MRRNAMTVELAAEVERERLAKIARCVADDPHGRGADYWGRWMHRPGVVELSGRTSDGCGLSKDVAAGVRPTLVQPGAAVADITRQEDGPGIVVRVTADRCIVRFPASGRTLRLTWHEVMLDHVAPDPAYLTAARPATRRRKGGARCAH